MIKKELEVDQSDPELYALRAQLKLLFGDVSTYPICMVSDQVNTTLVILQGKR